MGKKVETSFHLVFYSFLHAIRTQIKTPSERKAHWKSQRLRQAGLYIPSHCLFARIH